MRLDLHYPSQSPPDTGYPLVIFTHGGGWSAGSKSIGERGVRFEGVSALTSQGFCVASVDYRLCTPDGNITIRDCVTDSKDALRFLAKNAAQYLVDNNRVFTFGDSAVVTLRRCYYSRPRNHFGAILRWRNLSIVSSPACRGMARVILRKTALFNVPGQTDVRDRFAARIIKGDVDARTKLTAYREVSPVNYLHPESPPLLMMQGDKDPTIPVHHAHYMKKRGDAVKAAVEILIVENSAHNWREDGGPLRPPLDDIISTTVLFLKRNLEDSLKH